MLAPGDTTARLQVREPKQIDCDKHEQTADKKPPSFVFSSQPETISHHPQSCHDTPGSTQPPRSAGDGKPAASRGYPLVSRKL